MKPVSSLTLTILTESPIALSNDQGFGNYTPIKKYFFKDGTHAMTSVATVTYELRKCLFENFGWQLSDITIKKSNTIYNDVESLSEKSLEADVFGYLLPDQQISKTSPLRIIPFTSISKYHNDTQLITNRGFFDIDLERNRLNDKGEALELKDIPKTQAFANEEVFGDYYTYTVTIELDRIGVSEIKKVKEKGKEKYVYLDPGERRYMSNELRLQAVKDILQALTILTRDIKHQRVLLKPLAVVGGAFADVIPYFWNDIKLTKENEFEQVSLQPIANTIKEYKLSNAVVAVDSRLLADGVEENQEGFELSKTPVRAITDLADRLLIDEDHLWYLKD